MGELVWAWHEETGDLALKPVLQTMVREADALVELQVGADTVQAPPSTPYWANGAWTNAGNLAKDDELLRSDGLTMPVSQVVHRTEQATTVYNVEVADWHTYLVNWWIFVVHSAMCIAEAVQNNKPCNNDYSATFKMKRLMLIKLLSPFMLFASQCTTGARLRQFVLALLQRPDYHQEVALDDYLSALWHASKAYQEQPFRFVFIADLLQKTFSTAPMPYDWAAALRQPYRLVSDHLAPYQSPEYYAESSTYAFFELRIKRQILGLKHLKLQQPVPHSSRWANLTVSAFLERGTTGLEEETEQEVDATWGYLTGILADGQYVE